MTRRYIRGMAVLLALLCVLCTLQSVATVSAAEHEHRVVRIGYIDYNGFIVQDEDGSYSGYGVEYLERIAEYTGWEYEYVHDSWENHLKNLLTGEIDFVCHAQKTDERERNYLFSKYSIGSEANVLYVRKDDDRYYYNDFEVFDGMRIALMRDSFQNEEFAQYARQKGFEYTFRTYDTPEECFAALDAAEVDAVAMGSLALRTEYKVICRFGAAPFYFMTGKNNRGLVEELDDALGQIVVAGSSFESNLYEKYYGDAGAEQEVILSREEAEFIEAADPITVAFIPSRVPFSYEGEDGELTGITVDIMDSLMEHSGFTFSYEMLPAGMRVDEYLQMHPGTLIAGAMTENPMFQTDEYLVSDCFYSDDVALACLVGKEYDLNAGSQHYKLAIPRSYTALEQFIQKNYPQFEIVMCTSTEECLQMVARGEVDFMAQNVNVIRPYLANPHYEQITVVPTYFMEEKSGIIALNTSENRIVFGILNKCITALTQQEISQYTVDHTLSNQYHLTASDMIYKFRYALLAIAVLLVLIAVLVYAYVRQRVRNYNSLEEKNAQLVEAVAQADSASRAKGRFLARMSHEIRTPMNAVVGLTELARQHKEEPEQVEEYLNKIDSSSRVLLNIINDVLDMAAIENDKLKIAKNPFSLQEILASVETVYTTQFRQKNIKFTMDTEGVPAGQLIGDSLRVNQVLLNLISNAYKFTPEHGRVNVCVRESARRDGNAYYKFLVKDTGEGMTREMQERLFKPFEQEAADTAQKHGGSGLGLSITKNLVEMMGGSIDCKSRKGEGTTFTVSLPFGLVDETEETVELKKEKVPPAPAKEAKDYDFHGKKILLAEDTVMNADILMDLLSIVNLEVAHAWNGEEAVAMFKEAEPGTYFAILMDVQMPKMNGYEAAKAIRDSGHPQAGIPIYAMTANAFTEDVSAAINAGMDGHIAKPVDIRIVYEILEGLMG